MSYNRIILQGNLTRDPELSYLPSQTAVVDFALATTHKYRGADGKEKEDTCFIDCRMFGKRAEVISKYFSKGKPILIEGRLTFDRWDGPDGSKKSKHRVLIDSFTFIGTSNTGQPEQNNKQTPEDMNYPQPPDDDQIPF